MLTQRLLAEYLRVFCKREKKMSYLLDEKYAIPPNILYLYSYDGQPLREVYPLWSALHQEIYKKHCEEYRKGENENGENCFDALRQVVKFEILDKLLEKGETRESFLFRKVGTVLWGLLPHSAVLMYSNEEFRAQRESWAMSGVGFFNALCIGMRLEFAPIIAKCREIQQGIFAGERERRQALVKLDKLLLEIRQMNFLGGMAATWALLSAALVNVMRAVFLSDEKIDEIPETSKEMVQTVFTREHISEEQRERIHAIFGSDKEAVFHRIMRWIDKLTFRYQNTACAMVKAGLQKIRAGKFYKPRDDRALYTETIIKPMETVAAYANKLHGYEKAARVEKELKALISGEFKRLEKVMKGAIINDGEAKKIIAGYEKKGKIPVGMTEEFVRQLADEYRAFTCKG